MSEVTVILGARGFGLPCARRLGKGRQLLLGDVNADTLEATSDLLIKEGYRVISSLVDIADVDSVAAFAAKAPELGRLHSLVLTAGISPRMASPERILAVNLVGTITVMDAFLPHVEAGSVGVIISSNAANYAPVAADIEALMATGDPATIVRRVRDVEGADTGLGAYWLAKRCNQLRVQAAAPGWGSKGARIVSVSPGIMSTEMIHYERDIGAPVDEAVASLPVGRIGHPDEIATAIEWLCSPDASFITGTDLLVDGGHVAALRWAGVVGEHPQNKESQTAGV